MRKLTRKTICELPEGAYVACLYPNHTGVGPWFGRVNPDRSIQCLMNGVDVVRGGIDPWYPPGAEWLNMIPYEIVDGDPLFDQLHVALAKEALLS